MVIRHMHLLWSHTYKCNYLICSVKSQYKKHNILLNIIQLYLHLFNLNLLGFPLFSIKLFKLSENLTFSIKLFYSLTPMFDKHCCFNCSCIFFGAQHSFSEKPKIKHDCMLCSNLLLIAQYIIVPVCNLSS